MRHNQNRRSRGRSRKAPNPLSRSYESNGPDVKVRGNAAHVADKYMSLARDAHSSGDPISAENYLQHAEHYNRIVMAAQTQFQQSQPQFRDNNSEESYDDDRQMNGRTGRDRFDYNPEGDDDGEDRQEGGEPEGDRGVRQPEHQQQQQQRPTIAATGRADRAIASSIATATIVTTAMTATIAMTGEIATVRDATTGTIAIVGRTAMSVPCAPITSLQPPPLRSKHRSPSPRPPPRRPAAAAAARATARQTRWKATASLTAPLLWPLSRTDFLLELVTLGRAAARPEGPGDHSRRTSLWVLGSLFARPRRTADDYADTASLTPVGASTLSPTAIVPSVVATR